MVPKDLKYSEEHEWVQVEGDLATVGITDYAQKELVEVNEVLDDTPQIINSDPYGDGWMIKVKLADTKELENLLTPEEYSDLIGD
jgi:glycine cleavage system H protein